MQPIIGITTSIRTDHDGQERLRVYLNAAYSDAIYAAGGLPWLIAPPPTVSAPGLDSLLEHLDGVLFTGGHDLHPRHYGRPVHPHTKPMHERRGRFEVEFFRRADACGIPILAVCLGQQVANVARGGTLIQHIDDGAGDPRILHQETETEADTPVHAVEIDSGSRLHAIVGGTRLEVNSRHHQALDPQALGAGLHITARAPDGVIEAVEAEGDRFLVAVQWHPEDMTSRAEHFALFRALVDAAAIRHKTRRDGGPAEECAGRPEKPARC